MSKSWSRNKAINDNNTITIKIKTLFLMKIHVATFFETIDQKN